LELIIALLLFGVGLLAVAGMILTAQANLKRSALTLRGTVEALRIGDSLLEAGVEGEGEIEVGWGGWIEWSFAGTPSGGLRVWTLAPDRQDTVATLRVWPPPATYVPLTGEESTPSGWVFPVGQGESR